MVDIDILARLKNLASPGLKSLEDDIEGVEDASNRTKTSVSGFSETLTKFAGPAILGAAAAGLVAFTKSALDSGDQIAALRDRAGVSAEFLQTYGHIAQDTGGDIDDVADSVREMQLRLGEAADAGSGPAVDALNSIGISLENIQNLNAEQRFELLRDRISEVEDPARRLYLQEELLGGSTERLGAILKPTSDEMARLRQEAADTGKVLSNETVDALRRT